MTLFGSLRKSIEIKLGIYEDPENPVKLIKDNRLKGIRRWAQCYFTGPHPDCLLNSDEVIYYVEYNVNSRRLDVKWRNNDDTHIVVHTQYYPFKAADSIGCNITLSNTNHEFTINCQSIIKQTPVMVDVLKHDMKHLGIKAKFKFKNLNHMIFPDTIEDEEMIHFYYSELFSRIPINQDVGTQIYTLPQGLPIGSVITITNGGSATCYIATSVGQYMPMNGSFNGSPVTHIKTSGPVMVLSPTTVGTV